MIMFKCLKIGLLIIIVSDGMKCIIICITALMLECLTVAPTIPKEQFSKYNVVRNQSGKIGHYP